MRQAEVAHERRTVDVPDVPGLDAVPVRRTLLDGLLDPVELQAVYEGLQLPLQHAAEGVGRDLPLADLRPGQGAGGQDVAVERHPPELREDPPHAVSDADGDHGHEAADLTRLRHDEGALPLAHLLLQPPRAPGPGPVSHPLLPLQGPDAHQADEGLYVLGRGEHDVVELGVRHLQVRGPRGLRRARRGEARVERDGVFLRELVAQGVPGQDVGTLVRLDYEQLARRGGVDCSDGRPRAPERGLADPLALGHPRDGRLLHLRRERALGVVEAAAHDSVGVARLAAGIEERVPQLHVHRLHGAAADIPQQALAGLVDHAEEGVGGEVALAVLEAELRAHLRGDVLQGSQLVEVEHPLLRCPRPHLPVDLSRQL
mmetsp:Transcript_45153/g.127720  ORF Transcript_45153/g.127720 Transcript_45153/m.127720 type:complete len:372 (+) Transcript_45153:400-1515(+)